MLLPMVAVLVAAGAGVGVRGVGVGLRGVGVGLRGGGLGQTHARAGKPIMIAPEHSGFGVQRAEQQAAPGPAQLLSSELVVLSATFVLSAAAFDYVGHMVGHPLSDIVIALLRASSDEFVISLTCTLLVGMAAAIVWIWRFADQRWRVNEADLLERALTLTPTPPPGLTELLSAVEMSDTLEVATGVCKAMGADHVTDLVGHEEHFVKALFLYYENHRELLCHTRRAPLPLAERDVLLNALKAISARHGRGIWTKCDQHNAVKALKALSDKTLAERMFRLP